MYCKLCGVETEKEDALCPACEAEEKTEAALSDFAEEDDAKAEDADGTGEQETTELDEFLDDEDAKENPPEGEAQAETKKTFREGNRLILFGGCLALIVAMGVAAFFLFFWQGGPSDDAVQCMNTINQFSEAMVRGDLKSMQSFVLPGEVSDNEVPLFGPVDSMREYLQSEEFIMSYPDAPMDYSSDDAMLKSFVAAVGWSFRVYEAQDITISEDGKSASSWVSVSNGVGATLQKQWDSVTFAMVKHDDGKWYLKFPTYD